MKTVLSLIAVSLLVTFTACSSSQRKVEENKETTTEVQKPAPEIVKTKELSGYFVKNTFKSEEDVNLILMKDKTQFDDLFGVAKTMNNQIDEPDFDNNLLVAIILKSTDMDTDLKISETKKINNLFEIYATVTTGEKQTYSKVPQLIVSLPKDSSVGKIQLFVNGNQVKELAVK